VVPKRCVQRVFVILDDIRGIKLVTVLAVDDPALPSHLERSYIGESEVIHQPPLSQSLLNLRVPPHLRVVIARQIDYPLPLPRVETRECSEKLLILRPRHRHGSPV
jgi:hypothetical protein